MKEIKDILEKIYHNYNTLSKHDYERDNKILLNDFAQNVECYILFREKLRNKATESNKQEDWDKLNDFILNGFKNNNV